MRVLALDTTTRAGSVALVEDDRIVDQREGDAARTHAERLPGEILAIAEAHHSPLSSIDLFAVASGPGSFTGLRIGIATIQGLAFVSHRRIVAVSALEALAHIATGDVEPGTLVAPWMDAHRREVFSALYRVTIEPQFHPDHLVALKSPAVGDPVATLARWRSQVDQQRVVFVGDGAVLYREIIQQDVAHGSSATGRPSRWATEVPPLAGAIGRIALAYAQQGKTVDPAGVRALYVRRPDAEVDRERSLFNTRQAADATKMP